MTNSYNVFFGEKPFTITNHLDAALASLCATSGTLFINHPTASGVVQALADLQHSPAKALVILTTEVEQFWNLVKTQFVEIIAGGGIVFNDNAEVLFIFRKGKWDLPKGKLDPGETIEACAVREVMEETGLQNIELQHFIGNTYHVYAEKGKSILKTSVWYKMYASGNQALVPQTEEDIAAIQWLPQLLWPSIMDNTYPSIPEILNKL